MASAQYDDIPHLTPVSVEWFDSQGADEGWQDDPPVDPMKIVTVGQFWKVTDKAVTLVFSTGVNDGKIGAYIVIPHVNVTRLNRLKLDREIGK